MIVEALLFGLILMISTGAITLYIDDHDRKNYRPHSISLYLANLILNFVPGLFLYPIVIICYLFPGAEQYVPHYNPWFNFGLVEIPYDERIDRVRQYKFNIVDN